MSWEEIFTFLFGFRIHLDARQKAKKEGVHQGKPLIQTQKKRALSLEIVPLNNALL